MCGNFSKNVFEKRERVLIQTEPDHRHRARTELAAICYQLLGHDVEDQVLEFLEFARAAIRVAGFPRLKLRFNRRIAIAKRACWVKRRPACFLPVVLFCAVRPRGLALGHAVIRSMGNSGKAIAMRSNVTAQ